MEHPIISAPGMVDFGGGDLNVAWGVAVGFASTFTDGSGVDVRVFGVQLNFTEGWNLLASADGVTFTLLGTFAPAAEVLPYFSVDVDFNGTPVPSGARFLRFEGTQVPINSFTRGFDFDAVGVVAATAVPEPNSLTLIVLSFGGLMAGSLMRFLRG